MKRTIIIILVVLIFLSTFFLLTPNQLNLSKTLTCYAFHKDYPDEIVEVTVTITGKYINNHFFTDTFQGYIDVTGLPWVDDFLPEGSEPLNIPITNGVHIDYVFGTEHKLSGRLWANNLFKDFIIGCFTERDDGSLSQAIYICYPSILSLDSIISHISEK